MTMKKLAPFLALLCLLWACANPAFSSLYSVGHATDSAYKVYLDMVVAGQIKTNGVPKVSALYNTFQVNYRVALELVQFNTKAAPDTNVVASATKVITAIAVEKGAK